MAKRRNSNLRVCFEPLGPRVLDRKSRTDCKLAMLKMAAEAVRIPAMVGKRVAADIVQIGKLRNDKNME